MKLTAAIATGVLIMTSPADAQPRPPVQHYGNPTLNGQPLPFSEAVRVGEGPAVAAPLLAGGRLEDRGAGRFEWKNLGEGSHPVDEVTGSDDGGAGPATGTARSAEEPAAAAG